VRVQVYFIFLVLGIDLYKKGRTLVGMSNEDTHEIEIRNFCAKVTVRWHMEDASFDHHFGTEVIHEPVFDEAIIEDFQAVDDEGEVCRTVPTDKEIEELECKAFEKCC